MTPGNKKAAKKRETRELEFDAGVYDLKALESAASEFGPETGTVCTRDDGKVVVEFSGGDDLELEFRNLALLRTIEEKRSR